MEQLAFFNKNMALRRREDDLRRSEVVCKSSSCSQNGKTADFHEQHHNQRNHSNNRHNHSIPAGDKYDRHNQLLGLAGSSFHPYSIQNEPKHTQHIGQKDKCKKRNNRNEHFPTPYFSDHTKMTEEVSIDMFIGQEDPRNNKKDAEEISADTKPGPNIRFPFQTLRDNE